MKEKQTEEEYKKSIELMLNSISGLQNIKRIHKLVEYIYNKKAG
ncbi:hypothetical protein [Anaerocolumna aminovalerica]|nr:hypothetical protein [Anaerocolumna aminovalerica]